MLSKKVFLHFKMQFFFYILQQRTLFEIKQTECSPEIVQFSVLFFLIIAFHPRKVHHYEMKKGGGGNS